MTDFSPKALGEAYYNLLSKSAPDDPKRFMGDMSVIATDIFLTGLSLGNIKLNKARNNIPLFTNEARRQGFTGYLNANPMKSTVTMNVLARAGSDQIYDLLNDSYRWLNGIQAEQADDSTVENILNVRNEALWSGGATGLAYLFPKIKPFIGRNFLGVDDNAKRLATLGRTHNVPMSVFNVSNSQLVQGLPPVVGLFPIVAGRARLSQNAQMAAAYTQMLKSIDDFSPVHLFADAGLLIDKGFRDMVKEYGIMKGVMYHNVAKLADGLNKETFIPTTRIKKLASAIREMRKQADIPVETRIDVPGQTWTETQTKSLDDLFNDISGSGEQLEKSLMQLDGLPDYLNAYQAKRLVEKLNATKKNLPNLKLSENSDEALRVNDFHAVTMQSIQDFDNWKTLKGEQQQLAQQWKDSYIMANDFITENADSLQGRTAMLLKQTDPNIAIPGGVQRPGYLHADQMAKIFFDDQTVMSPMALKEMRKAFGDDAFKAATRAYFNDILNKNTDFVSGKLRVKSPSVGGGMFASAREYITGKGPTQKFQTISYNIPVVDINKVSDAFGLNDANRALGVMEMYKAMGTGSDAQRTKFAQEQFKKLKEIMEIAKQVEVPNYGDVSTFVKRRGVLGGLGSIANLFTGGALLSSPIASAGIMLMGRFGMNALSDPRFLDGMVNVLNPALSDTARKAALVTLGRGIFDPERAVNEGYDLDNINDIIELITLGDLDQSPVFNTRAADAEENAAAALAGRGVDPGAEVMQVQEDIQNKIGFDDMVYPTSSPLDLSVLEEDITQVPGGNNIRLNEAQRVAMAGGNLDEAIALRGQNPNASSIRRNYG